MALVAHRVRREAEAIQVAAIPAPMAPSEEAVVEAEDILDDGSVSECFFP